MATNYLDFNNQFGTLAQQQLAGNKQMTNIMNPQANPFAQQKAVGGIYISPQPTGSVVNPLTGTGAGAKTIPTYTPPPIVQNAKNTTASGPSVAPVYNTQPKPVVNSRNKTTPVANPNGLTAAQIAAGYSTIPGAYDPLTGKLKTGATPTPTAPTPGSAAWVYQQSQADKNNQQQYTDIQNYQQEQFNQTVDPEQEYRATLSRYQAQIDAINNIYNDQLTQSRIQNAPTYQARADQNRIQQLQGGFGSSAMGSAQTDQVTTANNQEQSAAEAIINDKRAQAISAVYRQVRQSSEAALTEKRAAKAKGADALLEYLNAAPERKKTQLSGAVKAAVSAGLDIENMTDDEIKAAFKGLDASPEDIKTAYTEEQATATEAANKSAKAEAETQKILAEVDNLKGKNDFEAAQKALDRALEEKKISVQWYNATTSRMSEDRQAAGGTNKNYDGATIPVDVKDSLVFDLQQNKTSKKKDKKSLQDFFAQYPEVNTKYLQDLYEVNL